MTKEEKKAYEKAYREANTDKKKEYREANADKMKEYHKAYHEANKDKIRLRKKEYLEANKDKRKEYLEANKDKRKEYQKAYHKAYLEANKDKRKEYHKAYHEANKDKISYRKNEYSKKRKATDPIFKLKCNIRSLISKSMRKMKYKKTSRTAEILGCTFEVFKEHIQEQFPRDMNWDNAGMWHYDHIIPVSSATSEEGLLRLNHYTNFQPLWEEDNLEKAARLDWVKCPIKYAK